MSNLENSLQADQIVEQYKNLKFDKAVAERKLRLLGLNETQLRLALGQILLEG